MSRKSTLTDKFDRGKVLLFSDGKLKEIWYIPCKCKKLENLEIVDKVEKKGTTIS